MGDLEITWELLGTAAGITFITERATWMLKNVFGVQGRPVQIIAILMGMAISIVARAALGAHTWQEIALSAVAGIVYGCAAIGINGLGADLDK